MLALSYNIHVYIERGVDPRASGLTALETAAALATPLLWAG